MRIGWLVALAIALGLAAVPLSGQSELLATCTILLTVLLPTAGAASALRRGYLVLAQGGVVVLTSGLALAASERFDLPIWGGAIVVGAIGGVIAILAGTVLARASVPIAAALTLASGEVMIRFSALVTDTAETTDAVARAPSIAGYLALLAAAAVTTAIAVQLAGRWRDASAAVSLTFSFLTAILAGGMIAAMGTDMPSWATGVDLSLLVAAATVVGGLGSIPGAIVIAAAGVLTLRLVPAVAPYSGITLAAIVLAAVVALRSNLSRWPERMVIRLARRPAAPTPVDEAGVA